MKTKKRKRVLVMSIRFVLAAITVVLLNPSSSVRANDVNTRLVSKVESQKIAKGKALFTANGCLDCHSINGHGCTEGVSLSSVGLRRDAQFMNQQLLDPEEHAKRNKKAFNSEPNLMTNPNLTPKEVELVVSYLRTLKKTVPAKGQKSKNYNTL
ncbi:hypothetical protein BH10CYA1_BH10CYA1_49930 [soil metagenome]